MDGWMDGWKDGWMDGWKDGWIDAWMQEFLKHHFQTSKCLTYNKGNTLIEGWLRVYGHFYLCKA